MVRTDGNPSRHVSVFLQKVCRYRGIAVHSHYALLSSKYTEQLELSYFPVLSYEDGFDFLMIEGGSLYVYSSTNEGGPVWGSGSETAK